jgi:FKBP-type peptidyl-prolyl cis-trans isomerase 2
MHPSVGDRVKIHYTGRFEDGTTFDSSAGGEPLEFVAGANNVISGLDRAILQMDEGEHRTITVSPEDAYGTYQEGLSQHIDRDRLPDGVTEGTGLRANIGGQETILWVTELEGDQATLDANHPLAGRTLTFDVELVAVMPSSNSTH